MLILFAELLIYLMIKKLKWRTLPAFIRKYSLLSLLASAYISYRVGWSHGKEKMSEGKFDFAKGSFYANPLHDRPVDDEVSLFIPYNHHNYSNFTSRQ